MDADESDAGLLSTYARERSGDAFARIVKRHAGLVHGIAIRVLRDDALARDVGQEVFVRLAKLAPGIDGVALPAWLHKTTYRAAVDTLRREVRRRRREARSVSDVPTHHSDPDCWDEATPLLDAALLHLKVSDRQALLARFYEDKTFREIGVAFGKTESGARMQVTRALEKVSRYLTHRGVCIPAVALATGLSAEFSKAAHVQALAAYSAVASNAVTASHSGTLLRALTTMTNTKKTALTTTLFLGLASGCGLFFAGKYFYDTAPSEILRDPSAQRNSGSSESHGPTETKTSSDDSPKAPLTPEQQMEANTALFDACLAGDVAAVEILLKRGANPSARNNDLSGNETSYIKRRETPLKEVLFKTGRTGVTGNQVIATTKLLLEAGADPDARYGGWAPPIVYACRGHFGPVKEGRATYVVDINVKLAQLLLNSGADPNKAADNGRRGVEIAVRKGSPEMVKAFLEAGADLNFKPKRAETLLDLAMMKSDKDGEAIVELLRGAQDHTTTPGG